MKIKFVPDHWYTKRLQYVTPISEVLYKKKYFDFIKKATTSLNYERDTR